MAELNAKPDNSIEPSETERASPHQFPPLELRLLGRFELVESDTGAPVAAPSKKVRALLAIIAVSPRLTISRSRLAALLWGDSTEDQARQSLRQLLSNLRRSLHPLATVVSSDDTNVRLEDSRIKIDLDSLLLDPGEACTARLAIAAAAYRGDFGLDMELGELEFDNWLVAERARFRNVAIPIMDRLVRGLARENRHQEALDHASALLAIDPLREETHRLIIAQEAILSGRASAMLRYESFRVLLRDELAVRPEPATIQLIESLRNLPQAPRSDVSRTDDQPAAVREAAGDDFKKPGVDLADPSVVTLIRRRGRPLAAWSLVAAVVFAISVFAWFNKQDTVTYIGDQDGRVSVAVLPFESPPADLSAAELSNALHRETLLAFSRSNRVSLIEVPDDIANRAPIKLGQRLRVRYLVKTAISRSPGGIHADASLIESDSGVSLWSASIPIDGEPSIKFAREFFGLMFTEIVVNQSRRLSRQNPDSTEAMLWRARAAQLQTRIGNEDPTATDLYKAILSREADNFFALLGLSNLAILRVARNQSVNRAADIAAATEMLRRAKPQAPNSSDVAFWEGMLNKLQGNFEQAAIDFERTMRVDPTHWNAAAQHAHVQMFLGHLQEGFVLMQSVAKYLLPDLGAAETAYIAAETALVAGHVDEAVNYLNMAISGNPTIGRIHALQAAALGLAGRSDDARKEAERAHLLSPKYTPEVMSKRGGPTVGAKYAAARDVFVAAFRAARGNGVTN